jgi:DNA-binding response OmpR family regulator
VIRLCAWCRVELGQVGPTDDPRTTHGLCPVCAAALAAPGEGRLRVLVVEDYSDGARSLDVLLRLNGHDSRVARDGPSALAAVGEWVPDVVLLDLGLPGKDGYAVARELRARLGERLRLVAVSGFDSWEHRQRSLQEGFDRYLVKPLDGGELLAMLQQYAGRLALDGAPPPPT